ncbi:hypothetical protein B296_00023691 [Ensete ventricosum]|uniref:Uncharacterized protein n=1 Tax=Ensete ventricosum TaxID=4639 RepID=A0A426XK18_ENSVE|nr:hypothetical protein B296_00023691 [Ensete ventricosum]
MARPPAGAVDNGLATCKGAVGCGEGPLQGQPPIGAAACSAAPARAVTYSAAPTRSAVACRHSARGRAYGLDGRARRRHQPARAATRGQQGPTVGRGGHKMRAEGEGYGILLRKGWLYPSEFEKF